MKLLHQSICTAFKTETPKGVQLRVLQRQVQNTPNNLPRFSLLMRKSLIVACINNKMDFLVLQHTSCMRMSFQHHTQLYKRFLLNVFSIFVFTFSQPGVKAIMYLRHTSESSHLLPLPICTCLGCQLASGVFQRLTTSS